MDELEFPDFGGEVAPVAPFGRFPYGEGRCDWQDRCDSVRSVVGTELGLALEDCEGVQVGITV